MKLFECQACDQPLYFENVRCESCKRALGFLPQLGTVTALEEAIDGYRALAEPADRYRYCSNFEYGVCNWLVSVKDHERLCRACRHNRTIPDLSLPQNLISWRRIEVAKHRLFYSLLMLRLPVRTKIEDAEHGLVFDLLAPSQQDASGKPVVVTTGYAAGVITLNISEADDAERERVRTAMGEPYRTLLGHFRHEIAHYYWDRLVDNRKVQERFRDVFGDERADYAAALQHHYKNGPAHDWSQHFVTAYASSHPWEDWAETWAHYFHMVDTLETAAAFGLRVRPRITKGAELAATIDFDPHQAPMATILEAWLPLTFAVNSLNRSMGIGDLYPFVLSPEVRNKLAFVHGCIHDGGKRLCAFPGS